MLFIVRVARFSLKRPRERVSNEPSQSTNAEFRQASHCL
jgi:hypothetical protein